MLPQTKDLPNPSDFDISPKVGFLSANPPAVSFRDVYYEPWDSIISKLPGLIRSRGLDKEIRTLPLLSTDKLTDDIEYRRAYVVLAFLVHALVWQDGDAPQENIPPQLSKPFLQVCNHLGMEPVLSYAGLCTWNWRLRNGGHMGLENLEPIGSFTGSKGEAVFYHVPVLIEYHGGRLVHLLMDALRAASIDERITVLDAFRGICEALDRMGEQFGKFRGVLDVDAFYHEHRPFMAGGKGAEENGLSRGMVFQMSDGSEVAHKLVGGSAAQSSIFPFLDHVLGVKHIQNAEFFEDMRAYMPGVHRHFLKEVSRVASLREYVESNANDQELRTAYHQCLDKLRGWRGKHIATVSKYIVQPARQELRTAVAEKIEVNGASETDQEWELQGTGGSALIPFLRQVRDDIVGIGI